MSNYPEIIKAIATLLWPIIIIIAFIVLKPAVAALIDSAKSRKFTLKVGGQELTMEEANEQQRTFLSSSQSEVLLRKKRTQAYTNSPDDLQKSVEKPLEDRKIQSILWVDDNPKNNSDHVQQLIDMDINVDLSLSTNDALKRSNSKRYDAIISDMGRKEGNKYESSAGLKLLKAIRESDKEIPFAILTRRKTARDMKNEVIAMGGTGITSRSLELFQLLNISDDNNFA